MNNAMVKQISITFNDINDIKKFFTCMQRKAAIDFTYTAT